MKNRDWRMENGEWRMENGEWENKMRVKMEINVFPVF